MCFTKLIARFPLITDLVYAQVPCEGMHREKRRIPNSDQSSSPSGVNESIKQSIEPTVAGTGDHGHIFGVVRHYPPPWWVKEYPHETTGGTENEVQVLNS